MPHIVKLTEKDQMLLINLLAQSYEYKINKKLQNKDSIRKMGNYYIDAIEKIKNNYIEVNNSKNCFWTWLADNLKHSGTKIWHSPECTEALEICEAAAGNNYDRYRLRRSAERLFEVNNEKTTSS